MIEKVCIFVCAIYNNAILFWHELDDGMNHAALTGFIYASIFMSVIMALGTWCLGHMALKE